MVLRLPVAGEPGSHPEQLIETARRAEDSGFDAVSISDHVVMGARADRYPWGDFPFPPADPWYEPLVVLTAIAASTSRIGLTTSILIVPLRPATVLAKTAATLDVISKGRLQLGVGTGWQQEEFEASGVDHAERGAILTATISACRALWGPDPARIGGIDIWCDPKPVRPGGIPVLFSGTLTRRNVKRIIELGNGWIPIMGQRRDGIAAGIDTLRSELEAAGRDPEALVVRCSARLGRRDDGSFGLEATMERSADLVEAGVTDLEVPLTAFPESDEMFAEARRVLGGRP